MASPSERTAAAEVTFFFINWRHPKTASARSESSQGSRRTSTARFALAKRGAERAPRFRGVAALLDRFGDVRRQLFVDLAAHIATAKDIGNAGTVRTCQAILSTRPTADVTACQRSSSAPSCFLPAVVNS